jgi:hypothetical protein
MQSVIIFNCFDDIEKFYYYHYPVLNVYDLSPSLLNVQRAELLFWVCITLHNGIEPKVDDYSRLKILMVHVGCAHRL